MDILLNGLWADRYVLAGTLASVLSVVGFAPYIRDILRGVTKPDRACWLIWTVLACMSGASVLSQGAGGAQVYIWVQMLGTLLVFALSVRFGDGAFINQRNVVILGIAGLGLVSWAMMQTPVYALSVSIAVSALGGLTTILKSYRAPQTETASAWGWMLVAAVLGVCAVGAQFQSGDILVLAYPVYLLVLYAGIVLAQMIGRAVHARARHDAEWRARRNIIPPLRLPTPATVVTAHSTRASKPIWPIRRARHSAKMRFAS